MKGGRRALIVGAGLAGSLLAVYLARDGWRVRVHERRGDPRVKGYIGGRSINLALSARGIDALAQVGLDKAVLNADAIAMRGRMMHPPATGPSAPATAFLPYSARGQDAINSVSRGGLNVSLIRHAANEPGVEFVFDSMCVECDLNAPACHFKDVSTPDGAVTRVDADLVLSADGAFSAVRGVMMKTDRFDYSQTYLTHGYKELSIPPAREILASGADANVTAWMRDASSGAVSRHHAPDPALDRSLFAMEPHALHIWPRGKSMMIALPNRDGSFTCTLFWPFDGEHGLHSLTTAEQVRAFFTRHYPDAVPLMPTLEKDYMANPPSSLVTVRCFPWQFGGKVALLGDAAHAIVPFFGQGMNAAFEDVKALCALLREHIADQHAALEAYQSQRKAHADAIAEMALENFIEMRDKIARPEFRYHKRVEQALHAAFPDRVTPLYNLVSFSTVPYAEAHERGLKLEAAVSRVIAQVPESAAAGMSDEAWRAKVIAAGAAVMPTTS